MVSPTRITVALNEAAIERMKNLAEMFDVSHARLVACLLDLPENVIKEILDDKLPLLFPSKVEERAKKREETKIQRKEALKAIKSMTPEQLAAILAAAGQGTPS